jgi:hypothetical protein
MKTRYRLYHRNGTFYCWDNDIGKRESLQTRERKQAIATKNEAQEQPALSLQKARIYLVESDPAFIERTWQQVMNENQETFETAYPAHELAAFQAN